MAKIRIEDLALDTMDEVNNELQNSILGGSTIAGQMVGSAVAQTIKTWYCYGLEFASYFTNPYKLHAAFSGSAYFPR